MALNSLVMCKPFLVNYIMKLDEKMPKVTKAVMKANVVSLTPSVTIYSVKT